MTGHRPAKGLRHWTSNRPTNPNCADLGPLDIEITHAGGRIRRDPNGIVLMALHDDISVLEPLPDHLSVLSGAPAILVRTNEDDFALTPEEARRFYLLALTPAEFFRFCEEVGAVYELHDDFYDPETGQALQPKTEVPDGDEPRPA